MEDTAISKNLDLILDNGKVVNLGDLMKIKNLSVSDLSRKMNVSRNTVSQWLHLWTRPSSEHLNKLKDIFGKDE
jgi:transcriptional regulator with XRE-family HTH domain